MADIAAVTLGGQLGKETTAGTSVAANKAYNSLGWTRMKAMGQGIIGTPQGVKVPTYMVPVGYRWSEWAFQNAVMDYNELAYVLCTAVKDVSPGTDGTNGKLWTFNQSKGVDPKRTYTFEQGNSVHAQKATYAHMTSLELMMSREAQTLGGNWRGQQIQDDITLTGSPTLLTPQIIAPQSFDVRIASSQAALVGTKQVETTTAVGNATSSSNATVTVTAAGMTNSPKAVTVAITSGDTPAVYGPKIVTALNADVDVSNFFGVIPSNGAIVALTARVAAANDATMNIAIAAGTTGITAVPTSTDTTPGVAPATVYTRPFGVTFSINNIQDALARMNSTDNSFITTMELGIQPQIKFITDADDAGMAYLTNWTTGAYTFIQVTSTGAAISGTIASAYYFSLQMACKIAQGYDPNEKNGAALATWQLDGVWDPTWNNILQIDLINTLAAL